MQMNHRVKNKDKPDNSVVFEAIELGPLLHLHVSELHRPLKMIEELKVMDKDRNHVGSSAGFPLPPEFLGRTEILLHAFQNIRRRLEGSLRELLVIPEHFLLDIVGLPLDYQFPNDNRGTLLIVKAWP